ncbi:MAG: MGMT family protein [Bacteroidales bacterium]|nr:MGMT family protein [Bacteroidales bacterium]
MKNQQNNNFFENVYKITRLIPFGRVTTYGAIAKFIGSPQSSRMVGWALNKCSFSKDFIPAHRVVNRNGMLTGKIHFGDPDYMQELLKNENIIVVNDIVQNFKEIFWDPSKEIIF